MRLHVGTHPPGLFLIPRGLLNVMEANPGAGPIRRRPSPSSVAVAFNVVEQYAHLARPIAPRSR